MFHIAATMPEIIHRLDHAIDDDMPEDPDDGSAPKPTREQDLLALAHIRAFRDDPSCDAAFRTSKINPYASHGGALSVYADDHGNEYWFDTENDLIVHAAAGASSDPYARKIRETERLPVADLRAIAEAYATRELPDFAIRKRSLHPLEDNRRRELYVFRWDDFSEPLPESEPAPFLQVSVFADGTLDAFTNALRS